MSQTQAADRAIVIPLMSSPKGLANIITVSKSGGDFTDPVAAMNSITDASTTNRYLVYIGPGRYNLEERLTIEDNVNLQGAGVWLTKLEGSFSTDLRQTSTVIYAANFSKISDLSIYNQGAGGFCTGIF